MHVTNSSVILSVLWSEYKNYHGYLRNRLGFSLDALIRFKSVRLTDESFPKPPLRPGTDQFGYP